MRNLMPKPSTNDEVAKMTQKEKDEYMKIKQGRDIMKNLISTLRKRDTKGKIEMLQKEMDELTARNNPLK